jgi:large subunit ribosomal protein L32
MTPLPKKRHAKARSRTRRAAIKLKIPSLVKCPNCGGLKYPHKECPKCHFYKESGKKPTTAPDKS